MSSELEPRCERHRLEGVITDKHLNLAEREFPGIRGFYLRASEGPEPPATFLDLLVRFGLFTPRPE